MNVVLRIVQLNQLTYICLLLQGSLHILLITSFSSLLLHILFLSLHSSLGKYRIKFRHFLESLSANPSESRQPTEDERGEANEMRAETHSEYTIKYFQSNEALMRRKSLFWRTVFLKYQCTFCHNQ